MISPAQALTRCVDLARDADPSRRSCFVVVDIAPDKSGVIAASDGASALRFVFDPHTFTAEHEPGRYCAPAAHFPKWGKHAWAFSARDGAQIVCEAYTEKSWKRAPKRDKLTLTSSDATAGVDIHWETLARHRTAAFSLSCGSLERALEPLRADATVRIVSGEDGDLTLVTGPLSTRVGCTSRPLPTVAFNAWLLERALDSFEGCGGAAWIWLPSDNPLDAAIVQALDSGASALVMPER